MININIMQNGSRYSVKATGHAGYDEPGKDIVCSSISTLIYTLVISLDNDNTNGLKYTLQNGNAFVEFDVEKEKTKNIFETIFLGISMVSDKYPDYVRIIRGE